MRSYRDSGDRGWDLHVGRSTRAVCRRASRVGAAVPVGLLMLIGLLAAARGSGLRRRIAVHGHETGNRHDDVAQQVARADIAAAAWLLRVWLATAPPPPLAAQPHRYAAGLWL